MLSLIDGSQLFSVNGNLGLVVVSPFFPRKHEVFGFRMEGDTIEDLISLQL